MQMGAYIGVAAMVGGAVAKAAGEVGEQLCPSEEGGPIPPPLPREGQQLKGGAGGRRLPEYGDRLPRRRRGPTHLRRRRRPVQHH